MIKNKLFIILFILLSSFGFVQDSLSVDAKTKEEVVNTVASIMQEKYVFPETGEKMANYIKTRHKKGAYHSYTEVKSFCKELTSDLREISHDKHLYVFYSPEEAYEVKARKKMLPEEEIKKIEAHYYQIEKRKNFGFHKIEILEGNIGYLDLRYFSDTDKSAETIIGAMKFLSNSDVVIIDLRKNGGGSIHPLLISYFFPPEVILLGGSICRDSTLNADNRTLPYVPGRRMPDIDLYILTSSRTFSAAEAFAYTLKHLKRAVVIGENTKGGAHPVDVLIVKGDILTQVAICNSYNPITKTNWEGVGVSPDIEVKSENAFPTAHLLAVEKMIEKTTDKKYKKELERLSTKLKKGEF